MTDRQQAFIRRLVSEKALPHDSADRFEAGGALLATRVANGEMLPGAHGGAPRAYADTMNPAQASNMIDWLLSLPNVAGAASPAVDVPAGRYALVDGDGAVKFYILDRPTEGRWAGYTFLNAQASEERHPIRNRATRDAILAEIAADPLEAMVRYGHELGRCGNCGRTLTDETSRAAGIGPDCAARLGIDRASLAAPAVEEFYAAGTVTVDEFQEMCDEFLVEANAILATAARKDGEDDGINLAAYNNTGQRGVAA